jgi:hypothetical protein
VVEEAVGVEVEAEAVRDESEEESVILVFASSSRIKFVLLLTQVKKERGIQARSVKLVFEIYVLGMDSAI